MARATGVQITGTVVRVVDIDGSPKRFKVRGFAEAAIDLDESGGDVVQATGKALKEAFRQSKAGKEHVILGIPMRDCIVREISVPFTNPEQIRKVIKFESESHLHSCSIDDVVICFHKVAEQGSRSTLLVVAAQKDMIARQLMALERIGVDPLSVDIDAAGLFALLDVAEVTEGLDRYLVCEIGYTSTMIMLIVGGKLRLVRSVRMGTDSITSRVGKDLDLAPAEARTRTNAIMAQERALDDDLFAPASDLGETGNETAKSSSELERDIIRQRQGELVKRLEQEIYRSIAPAALAEPLEAIFVIGPGSNLPRLQSDLATRMELPVRSLGLLDTMDHKFSAAEAGVYGAAIPVAAGLALKHVGHDPLRLDFRQEEFVFARRFDRLKVPLLCLGILFCALNFFWWFYEKKMSEQRFEVMRRVAEKTATEFAKVMTPEQLGSLTDKVPVDGEQLTRLYRGASAREEFEPIQRINYMGSTVASLRKQLLDKYGLSTEDPKRRSSGSRSATRNIPADASEFRSALSLLEWVTAGLHDLGIKQMSVNRLIISPNDVQFEVTLPEQVEYSTGIVRYQELVSLLKENIRKYATDSHFQDVDNVGRFEPNKQQRGVDVTLKATFVRQDR